MWSGLPRPTLPNRIITNCYAPPRGPEPPRVEVSAPGADKVKHIMPLRPFPLWRVRGRSTKQFVSEHALDASSCSGHGSWRGLYGERSYRDPERRHPADYR